MRSAWLFIVVVSVALFAAACGDQNPVAPSAIPAAASEPGDERSRGIYWSEDRAKGVYWSDQRTNGIYWSE